MENLIIEQSRATPLINFNSDIHVLKLSGESYPENAFKFYEPIFDWLDTYLELELINSNIIIEFALTYINSSSIRCIMMLLDKFESAYINQKSILVRWYYDLGNESSLECAEELKEDITLPFEIIPQE